MPNLKKIAGDFYDTLAKIGYTPSYVAYNSVGIAGRIPRYEFMAIYSDPVPHPTKFWQVVSSLSKKYRGGASFGSLRSWVGKGIRKHPEPDTGKKPGDRADVGLPDPRFFEKQTSDETDPPPSYRYKGGVYKVIPGTSG